jgi:hypothetical protein
VSAGVAGSESNFTYSANGLKIGVGGTRNIDVFGNVRSTGNNVSGFAGPGIEMDFSGSTGYVTAYNRSTVSWLPIGYRGSAIYFEVSGTERARFAASTGNLLLGTTSDDATNRLQVAGSVRLSPTSASNTGLIIANASTGPTEVSLGNSTWGSNYYSMGQDTTGAYLYTNGAQPLRFFITGAEAARFTATNRNLLIGITAETNFKLDIASSGSSGTLRAYDQTATTGVTQMIVRAGAGQSSTNLQTWQNGGGSTIAALTSNGDANIRDVYSLQDTFWLRGVASSLDMQSGFQLRFSSTSAQGGTKDLSLSRVSANVLQVGDGGSNANGFLDLKTVRPVGSTVALLPATPAIGMLATVTDANATTIDSTVAGGGSNVVGVWYNGTAWKIYSGGAGSGGSPGGSGTELQVRGGASTFSALASSSVPNAGELWIGQTTANASATRALFQVGSVALSGFSANGTQLAVNSTSGFTGNLIDARVNSVAGFSVSAFGLVTAANLSLTGTSGIVFSSNNSVPVGSSSSGASAATRFLGSAGVAATNFVAIRNSSGGTPTDQLRINGDQKAVMVGQTANTTSLTNVSMYVSDRTASGNTQHVIEGGGSQSTDILSVYANNATPLAGTKHVAVISTGQFRSVGILVASLPVAAAGNAGAIATVTDALTPALGVAVVGGGAVTALVFSNGSVWKVAAF